MKITDVQVWVVAPYRSAHPVVPPPGAEEWARQWEFGALRLLTASLPATVLREGTLLHAA